MMSYLNWPEVTSKRNLHSKTFQNPANSSEFTLVASARVQHYKTNGLESSDLWQDIDLSNPNDIKALYQLTPTPTGIGYTFTPREPNKAAITINMTNSFVSGAQAIKEYRPGGIIYFPNIAPDIDVYMKPLPHRYGIFKVLKSASATKTFTFTGSWTKAPTKLTDADGNQYTGNLANVLKNGLTGLKEVYFDGVLIPKRDAWDANGRPVRVDVSIKQTTLTEVVVPDTSTVYPITVDTDASYDATDDDFCLLGYDGSGNNDYTGVRDGTSYVQQLYSGGVVCFVGQQRFGDSGAYNYYLYRFVAGFDTSGLPDTATISAATFKFYLFQDTSTTDFNVTVVSYTGSYPATSGDGLLAEWQSFGSTSYGALSTNGIGSTGSRKNISLNSTGIAAISKTGSTIFGLRSSRDLSSTAPSGDEYIGLLESEEDEPDDSECQLAVTYTTSVDATVTVPSAMSAPAAANAPTVSGVWNASVPSELMTAAANVGTPSVTGVQNATVTLPSVSSVSASSPTPTVSGVWNASVAATLSTANSASPTPTVLGVWNASVSIPVTSASAQSLTPSLSGTASTTAPTSTALAEALVSSITGIIGAPVLTAIQDGLAIDLSW
jgi:hypothetical protein